VSAFSGFAGAASFSPIRSTGLNLPTGVAVDGAGAVWVTNGAASGSLAELSSSGVLQSPASGFGSLNMPAGLGIDPSGCLWTANLGDSSVSEFVGIASPVTTPLAASAGP
jgi:DNA-binding beta-propeller fold protein YncE